MSERPSTGRRQKRTPARATPRFFRDAAALRAWFVEHAATAPELVAGFYKVGSGRASITWPESVDEALCVGWIDGVRQRIDDEAYQIRFTPRRDGSIWSAVNIARAEALIAAGRMTEAGRAAFDQRIERRSSVYSYEQAGALELEPALLAEFQRHEAAWAWFAAAPPSYRRTLTYWVVSAKQPATRARRLARLIAACAAGQRLLA